MGIYGPLTYNEDDEIEEIKHKNKAVIGIKEKESIRKNLYTSTNFVGLFNYWARRAKLSLKINSQIAGILEKITNPDCDFCGKKWGLKCEPINNLENTFYEFLRSYGFSLKSWNTDDWQNYFQKNSVTRTICYECFEEIRPKKIF